MASLTAGKRVPWAEARQKHFMSGQNARSLKTIESAAFAVSLDEDEVSTESSEELNRYAKSLLHGTTSDRWFDKTFTMVVYKNGLYGMNVEHTWADAPITGMWLMKLSYSVLIVITFNFIISSTIPLLIP